MIIYNITVNVEWSIHEEWLRWVTEEEIPQMLTSKLFDHYHLLRLLEVDESNGPTYALQFYAPTLSHYNQYLENPPAFQGQKQFAKWGDRIVDFRTVMEVVN